MSEFFEVCRYRTLPGTSPEVLHEALRRTSAWLERQPGYLSREFFTDPSGTCAEILRWSSRAEAEAAMAASMQAPEIQAASAHIDFGTFVALHAAPLPLPAGP